METLPDKPNLTMWQVIYRTTLWALLIFALTVTMASMAGCMSIEDRCTGYGYSTGTPAYRDCIAAESRASRQRAATDHARRQQIHHAPAPAAHPPAVRHRSNCTVNVSTGGCL